MSDDKQTDPATAIKTHQEYMVRRYHALGAFEACAAVMLVRDAETGAPLPGPQFFLIVGDSAESIIDTARGVMREVQAECILIMAETIVCPKGREPYRALTLIVERGSQADTYAAPIEEVGYGGKRVGEWARLNAPAAGVN